MHNLRTISTISAIPARAKQGYKTHVWLHLSGRGFADVKELATKWKHAVVIPAYNAEATDGQGLS